MNDRGTFFLTSATGSQESGSELFEVIEQWEQWVGGIGDGRLEHFFGQSLTEGVDEALNVISQCGRDIGPSLDPEISEIGGDAWCGQSRGEALGEAHLTIRVPGVVSPRGLREVVDHRDDGAFFETLFLPIFVVGRIFVDIRLKRSFGEIRGRRWPIVDWVLSGQNVHMSIFLNLSEWATRSIDRDEMVVDAESVSLSVVVSENASLEHLFVRWRDSRNQMGRGHRDLFGFQEVILEVLIQDEGSDLLHRDLIFGPLMGGIQDIKVIRVTIRRGDDLNVKVPAWVFTHVDGVDKVSGHEVPIHHGGFSVIVDGVHALVGGPSVTNVRSLVVGVGPDISVDSGTVDVTIGQRNAKVVHQKGQHVCGLGEIREIVQDSPPFRNARGRVGFEGMDEFRELDTVADEEDREVDANNVVVSF